MEPIILEIEFWWFSFFWFLSSFSRTWVKAVWSWWHWRSWWWQFVAPSSQTSNSSRWARERNHPNTISKMIIQVQLYTLGNRKALFSPQKLPKNRRLVVKAVKIMVLKNGPTRRTKALRIVMAMLMMIYISWWSVCHEKWSLSPSELSARGAKQDAR